MSPQKAVQSTQTTPCSFFLGVPKNHLILHLRIPGSVQGRAARGSWKESPFPAHGSGWAWISFMAPSHSNHSGIDAANITWSLSKTLALFPPRICIRTTSDTELDPRQGRAPQFPPKAGMILQPSGGFPRRSHPALALQAAEAPQTRVPQAPGHTYPIPSPYLSHIYPTPIPYPPHIRPLPAPRSGPSPAPPRRPRPFPRAHWLQSRTLSDRQHRWPIRGQAAQPVAEGGRALSLLSLHFLVHNLVNNILKSFLVPLLLCLKCWPCHDCIPFAAHWCLYRIAV